MKGLRVMKGIFLLLVALGPVALFAFPILPVRPFGGRVLLAPVPDVTCPGSMEPTSPFTIVPVSPFMIPGPFSEVPGPQSIGKVVPGAWILGLYWSTPIPDCTTELPPVPIPVFKAYIQGTNVPDVPALPI